MNSITKQYLVEIVSRVIGDNIDVHRKSKRTQFSYEYYTVPTDEELLDFIISIPYFDDRLKDFLIGNVADTTIIISQSWENEFIIKTQSWANSFEWLQGSLDYFNGISLNREAKFLSLPY